MAQYGIQTLFNESVSAVTATNTVDVGTARFEGGNEYRYVYNGIAAAIQPGYGVVLVSGGSGYTVCLSAALGDMCHGVVQNATITSQTYGWVQRRGLAKIQVASGGVAVKQAISLAASCTFDTYLTTVASGATGGLNYAQAVVGFSIGSAVTAGSILASIDCRG